MNQFLRRQLHRRDWVAERAQAFAHENPDILVIVADPDTDLIFVGYDDKMTLGAVKNSRGRSLGVVKAVLRRSKFKSKIDEFLVSISETLWTPLKNATINHFFAFIDGSLFNIARALDRKSPSTTIDSKESTTPHTPHAEETSIEG